MRIPLAPYRCNSGAFLNHLAFFQRISLKMVAVVESCAAAAEPVLDRLVISPFKHLLKGLFAVVHYEVIDLLCVRDETLDILDPSQ